MTAPRLIVVSDFTRGPEATLLGRIEGCLSRARPGSVLVQLREPDLATRARLALGRRLLEITRRHQQRFAVNDRLDLARLLQADAVHLGEGSVGVADARRLMPDAWISCAWHAKASPPEGADALVLSPVFEARHGRPALGLDAIGSAAGGPPIYALGGVTPEHAARAVEAGAAGVAVIGAVLDQDDPGPLLAALGMLR